jgi:hypothetical protein
MKTSGLIAASLLLAGPAFAGDPPTIPKELHAGWGLNGHCNKSAERFEVNAYRGGWGVGAGGAMHYDPVKRALIWDDTSRTDVFYVGAAGKQMFHEKTPGGERERLVKCPDSLMKYAGH